jgi:hypothetical protein
VVHEKRWQTTTSDSPSNDCSSELPGRRSVVALPTPRQVYLTQYRLSAIPIVLHGDSVIYAGLECSDGSDEGGGFVDGDS